MKRLSLLSMALMAIGLTSCFAQDDGPQPQLPLASSPAPVLMKQDRMLPGGPTTPSLMPGPSGMLAAKRSESQAALEKLKKATTSDEKVVAKQELKAALEKEYDRYLKKCDDELKRMEEKLNKLREQVERRRDAKEEAVKLRLATMENIASGLGWPGDEGGRSGIPSLLPTAPRAIPGLMSSPPVSGRSAIPRRGSALKRPDKIKTLLERTSPEVVPPRAVEDTPEDLDRLVPRTPRPSLPGVEGPRPKRPDAPKNEDSGMKN